MKRLLVYISKIIDAFYIKHPIILYYHGIKYKEDFNNPSPDIDFFKKQMEILLLRGFKFFSLKDIYLWSIGQKTLPKKAVALTFDDGLENIYSNVFPLLKEFKISATIYIIYQFIGEKIYFSHERSKPQLIRDIDFNKLTDYEFKFLNCKQIIEMHQSGLVDFGSHTLSHSSLSHIISEKALQTEINNSKINLEQKLSIPIETFCYPYGNYNETVKKIVKEAGYLCAVSTNKGNITKSDDPFEFKRISDINLFINHPPLLKKLWNIYGNL